jgi:hypothetical protein
MNTKQNKAKPTISSTSKKTTPSTKPANLISSNFIKSSNLKPPTGTTTTPRTSHSISTATTTPRATHSISSTTTTLRTTRSISSTTITPITSSKSEKNNIVNKNKLSKSITSSNNCKNSKHTSILAKWDNVFFPFNFLSTIFNFHRGQKL